MSQSHLSRLAAAILTAGALLPALLVRSEPATPPAPGGLLTNSGFEMGAGGGVSGWTRHGSGFEVDGAVRHGGAQSIRCQSTDGKGQYGAQTEVRLEQKEPAPVLVSGWSRAAEVGGARDADYSLYVDLEYTDGTPLWGQVASFSPGTHDWQRRQLLVLPTKPIRTMRLDALFRHHTGTAWFDDFQAQELRGPRVFDGQPIAPPTRSYGIAPQKVEPGVGAGKSLALGVSPSGEINDLRLGKDDVTATYAGGFFARDVSSGSTVQLLRGSVRFGPAYGVRLQLASGPLHLRCDATIAPVGDAIDFRGNLVSTSPGERAITLYLMLPVQADRWQWGEDIRRSETIRPDREYSHQVRAGAGATGGISLYPFASLTGPHGGLGLADQVDHPDVCRIFYNAPERKLAIAWDVATPPGAAAGKPIPFHCTLFPLTAGDPAWGFREAAARFYRLNAERYRRRATAEGIWMPFTDPAKVAHPEDFGIAYHEGDGSVASDDRLGILSFRYTEPMTYWMPMPPEMPRTYDHAIALLHKNAESGRGEAREMSRAALNSGTWDENGRFNLQFRNEPWANGAVFLLNPDPGLPATADRPTRASLAYTKESADRRYGPETVKKTGELDGEYLDSLELGADTTDFRPEHLGHSRYPLTFDTDSHRAVLPEWYSTYAFTHFLSDDLHRRGKLLMANSTPIRFSVYAPVLDVMGIEVNWKQGDRWAPDSDETMCLRRTMSGTKPYLLLMNTDFRHFSAADVERYFQRALFYGIYPSMFSADASTHPYWSDPALYNRDRPLFQKYVPIIRKLSAAGWQPVTHARSSSPELWLERFGDTRWTLFNPTDHPIRAEITLDDLVTRAAGRPPHHRVQELLSDTEIPTRTKGLQTILSLEIAPESVKALEIR